MAQTEVQTEVQRLREAVQEAGGMVTWTSRGTLVTATVHVGADTFTAEAADAQAASRIVRMTMAQVLS